MGTSCSSLKKEHKKSIDSSTSIDEKRCSNKSVETRANVGNSINVSSETPHFESSREKQGQPKKPPTHAASELRLPSQSANISYENHLCAPSVTPSPLPSSHTPSPYATPSTAKQLSLTPSGLPNLEIFSNDIRYLLIGQKLSRSSPLSQLPFGREFNIHLITNDIPKYEPLLKKVSERLKQSLLFQKYNVCFSSINLDIFYLYDEIHQLPDVCLNTLNYLSDRGCLIPVIILNEKENKLILPNIIEESTFHQILCEADEPLKDFFQKWYYKDNNHKAPAYVLHKLTKHNNFLKSHSIEDKKQALSKWYHESQKAISFLSQLSKCGDLVSSTVDIQLNFLANELFGVHMTTILIKQGKLPPLSTNAQVAITKIEEKVLSCRKLVFNHSESLESSNLDEALYEFLVESIKRIVESISENEFSYEFIKQLSGLDSNLCKELIVQDAYRQKLDNRFVGRQVILSHIQSYLISDSRKALIIHGLSGSGKSTLVARASAVSNTWLPSAVIVYRFAAISEQSFTIEQLLRSVCEQLCVLYGEHICIASSIASDLKQTLTKLLSKANDERPLILMIDGIDQINKYGWMDFFGWLDQELSAYVKVVISVSKKEFLEQKKVSLPSHNLLDCSNITQDELEAIFNCILLRKGRKISESQRNFILTNLISHFCPRSVRLLAFEMSKICHSMAIEELSYLTSEDAIISHHFDRVGSLFESPLLAAIITMLTSTKYGLPDSEVIDILQQLEPLRDMIYSSSSDFPYSLWSLIRYELSRLIEFCYVDGVCFMRFSTIQIEILSKKSSQRWKDVVKATQNELLNYFRVPASQLTSEKTFLGCNASYNQWPSRRKALEYPYLLLNLDGKLQFFCEQYCFNLSWLCYKMFYLDSFSFLEDIELFKLIWAHKSQSSEAGTSIEIEKILPDIRLLGETIKASAYPLRYQGMQIISQLYCRLDSYFCDKSEIPSLPRKYHRVSNLVNACRTPLIPSLLPINTHFMALSKKIFNGEGEGNISKELVRGAEEQLFQYDSIYPIKGDQVHVIAISTLRGEISVWNILREKPVRILYGINQPKDIRMIDKYRAVVLCNRGLKIYNLDEGTLENRLKGVMNQKMPFFGLHDENYLVALSRNRMCVNMQSLKTGDLETTFKVGEDRFLNSLLVSANGKICVCGDETQKPFPLLVWDLSNRKLIYDLRIPHHEFITRLSAISDDGHYVVCVSKELNSISPNFIIVYDLQSGTLFKKWKPDCDTVSITISSQASCVVNGLESSLILVWDLSTGAKRLTLEGHSSPIDHLQVDEKGNNLLSYDSSGKDMSIRLWSLENGLCLAVFTPDQPLSTCFLTPCGTKVVICHVDSSKLYTLILRKKESKDEKELRNLALLIYGDAMREGNQFDLSKD